MLVLSCNRITSLLGLSQLRPQHDLNILELQGNCVADIAELQHLASPRPRSVCLNRDGLSNPVTSAHDYASTMLSVCPAAVIIDDVPPSVLTRSVASPPTSSPPLHNQPRLQMAGRRGEQLRQPLSRIENVLQRHKTRTAAEETRAVGVPASKSPSTAGAATSIVGSGLITEAREVLELELRMERLEFMCKQQEQQQKQQQKQQQEQQQKQQRFGLTHAFSDQSSAVVALDAAPAAPSDMRSRISQSCTPVKACVRYVVILPSMLLRAFLDHD